MGIVTNHLIQLVARQVEDAGLVVWYDPELAYTAVAEQFKLPRTTVARYTDSFLSLRRDVDGLLNGEHPPRLVVYVPRAREQTDAALIELDVAGCVMQPRQQPPSCNTRLSVVARNALRPVLGEEQVVEIERQVELGKLSLADLDSLAEQGQEISTGSLRLVFGTANPLEVGLAFLRGPALDEAIARKEAQRELQHLLQVAFDIELPAETPLADWRTRLGRHLLLTEFLSVVGGPLPATLESVSRAHAASGIDTSVRLVRNWRNGRADRESYVAAAQRTEQELGLRFEDFPRESLARCETFPAVEQGLLQSVEEGLVELATPQLLDLAQGRRSGFWAEVDPGLNARWALICAAAEVLLEANRVARELKTAPSTIAGLVQAYALAEQPWCLLDTHHRQMESRKYHFEFAAGDAHHGLERLLTRAAQRYNEVGGNLAKVFVTQYARARHPVEGVVPQREIFAKFVQPKLPEGKLAYVWVDALRYEMARELCRLLAEDFTRELQPAIATVPTITEIGMAALLPGAEHGVRVVSAGAGKLALQIGDSVLRDRKERVAFLKQQAGVAVFDTKLEDLLPKPSKKVREGLDKHALILVTSQEIDELGEADNVAQARLQIDGVLGQLRRGLRLLAEHGVRTIVLVADHGHLFGDEIGEDMKIESPGGQIEDLHRRVWVGQGGNAESSYLRMPLAALGVDSDLDLATPWTFAVFRSKGGGRAYFHGGLSPQELLIPVMVLHPSASAAAQKPAAIRWTLTPGTAKLTTRFLSVQITGVLQPGVLFALQPPRVRIELRADKKCVSEPVSASYGFEDATREVALKVSERNPKEIEPNTVALMLTDDITQKSVGLYLVDAVTGQELAEPVTIPVAISM